MAPVVAPQKIESPRVKVRAEPEPNMKRHGDQAMHSEAASHHIELLKKILLEYPQDRLENDIFTLNQQVKQVPLIK